jgi:putative inorganic carbon (HCO3(-)) transporter
MGLIATLSRGGLAAAAIIIALLAAVAAPRRLFVVAGALVACALFLMVVANARMLNAFDGGSASLRFDVWTATLAMIRDHPVWGYGPDGFLYNYNPRYVQPTAWAERFTAHAHNLVLDFWVRLGIIGAAVVTVAIGACLASVATFVQAGNRRETIADAALIGLLAAILHGMVDNGYFVHDLAMSAWLLIWLAMQRRTGVAKEGTVGIARSGRWRMRIHRVAPVR